MGVEILKALVIKIGDTCTWLCSEKLFSGSFPSLESLLPGLGQLPVKALSGTLSLLNSIPIIPALLRDT